MAERIDQDKCSICLSDYKQPKILDCQHSFCQICLEDHVHSTSSNRQFQCPLCRRNVTLPEDCVKNLPTNDAPRCGFIDGCKNGSCFRCRDCDQNLCRSCRRTHDSLKMCKGHVVVSWDEPGRKRDKPETQPVHDERDLCPCGNGKRVEFLCEHCSECVCSKCCFENHIGHKLKYLQDEGVKQQIKDEMVSLNDELKQHINRLSEFRETVKTKKTEVAATVEEICGKIDVHVQKVCDEVTRIGENIKEDVKKIYLQEEKNASSTTSDITSFNKLLEDIEISLENMKASVIRSTNVLDERSVVQKIKRLDQLRQEVKDCGSRKMVIPSVSVMEFVAGEIDRDILSKQVGRLDQLRQEVKDCGSRKMEMPDVPVMKFVAVEKDRDILSKQVGRVVGREGMFEVYFNIDEIGRIPCNSRKVESGGLTWSVSVYTGSRNNVRFELYLIETPQTPCTVDHSIKLVNINNDQQSVIKHGVTTFTLFDDMNVIEFPSWSELTDRRYGFINENNEFKIQVRLKQVVYF